MAIGNFLPIFILFYFDHILLASTQDVVRWIESPRITNWGNWKKKELCPPNTWVTAVNLKIEPHQGEGDDTALNGIKLTCTSADGRDKAVITSGEGQWGFYRGTKYCSSGFATGFQLRSEPDRGRKDDRAATDFSLTCTHFDGKTSRIAGAGVHTTGEYTEKQVCPRATAICGIRTQIEYYHTALNNVDFACCLRKT